MSSDIAVIIPSWTPDRAQKLVIELMRRERRQRAHYVIVGCEAPHDFYSYNNIPSDSDTVTWVPLQTPLSPVEAMSVGANIALADPTNAVLLFLHDDVEIDADERGWDAKLLQVMSVNCDLAGYGGSIGFAADDIYKIPYDHRQLIRVDFVSNMREAELHGRRVDQPMRVAALDGFSLACSREFYQRSGGWDACLRDGIQFHMYDAWISCRAAELGYSTWMLPLRVHHAGGQTSVQQQERYAEVVARLGYTSPQELYDEGHKRVYERFKRVLPIRIKQAEIRRS